MEHFKTYITFASGDTHVEDTPETALRSTIHRLLNGPAAIMRMIKEFKIVDTMDCIVFLAKDNVVVHPSFPQSTGEKHG